MSVPAPALYKGRVTHSRFRPFRHRFSYRVFYGLFDVDRVPALDRELRWFSLGKFNLFGFDPGDHGAADGSSLRAWAERALAIAGVDLEGGPIRLLAFPRVLGYAFNPISLWYCYGPDGELRGVLHEVRNTFGDRHTYVVPVGHVGLRHEAAKHLHVSPFNEMDQQYRFSMSAPGERLTFGIEQRSALGDFFRAGMALSRVDFSDTMLVKLFVTHPLLTLKVTAGIHFQALKLWLKGGRYHERPEPPERAFTLVDRSSVAA